MGTGGAAGAGITPIKDRSVEQNEKVSSNTSSPRMSSIAPSYIGNNNQNQPSAPSNGLNFGAPTWRATQSEIGTDISGNQSVQTTASEPMSVHSMRTQPWAVEQLFVASAKAILGHQDEVPTDPPLGNPTGHSDVSEETKDKEKMVSRGLLPEGGDVPTPFYNRSPSYHR